MKWFKGFKVNTFSSPRLNLGIYFVWLVKGKTLQQRNERFKQFFIFLLPILICIVKSDSEIKKEKHNPAKEFEEQFKQNTTS